MRLGAKKIPNPMNHIAMLGGSELVVLAVVIAVGISCWLVFSRSSDQKKDE